MTTSIENRKARRSYSIEDTIECGIMLKGLEVKALREGRGNLTDTFCMIHDSEVWMKNFYLEAPTSAHSFLPDPKRDRKLLLRKSEIRKLEKLTKEKGRSLIPLEIFFNEKGIAKLKLGVGMGKKSYEKRETIKEREAEREMKSHEE